MKLRQPLQTAEQAAAFARSQQIMQQHRELCRDLARGQGTLLDQSSLGERVIVHQAQRNGTLVLDVVGQVVFLQAEGAGWRLESHRDVDQPRTTILRTELLPMQSQRVEMVTVFPDGSLDYHVSQGRRSFP